MGFVRFLSPSMPGDWRQQRLPELLIPLPTACRFGLQLLFPLCSVVGKPRPVQRLQTCRVHRVSLADREIHHLLQFSRGPFDYGDRGQPGLTLNPIMSLKAQFRARLRVIRM